jgi:hypothetical protein
MPDASVDAVHVNCALPGVTATPGVPGIVGGLFSPTFTVIWLEVVAFPAASSATAVRTCDPFGLVAV